MEEYENDFEGYLKVKLLDIEENAYKCGFIDGKKVATRNIIEEIAPLMTEDGLKRLTRLIRNLEVKNEKEIDEMVEEIIWKAYQPFQIPSLLLLKKYNGCEKYVGYIERKT